MPKKKDNPRFAICAVSLLLIGGLALAQNANPNSAGPTKNDIRLRIVEPVEGAAVVGSSVRVTVSNSMPQPAQESTGTANMPNPSFRVYLEDTLKGELKRDENVLTIDNVPLGSHRLVVEAMNSSGEVIDRKEIRFQTVATVASITSPSSQMTEKPQVAPAPAPAEPAPLVAQKTSEAELPHTASAAPNAALAGFALLIGGVLVSRGRRARTVENPNTN